MLLAIDVGNTHTVIGLFNKEEINYSWRLPTVKQSTPDYISLELNGLLRDEGLDFKDIDGFCFCSVVPEVSNSLDLIGKKLDIKTLNLDTVKTKVIQINYKRPESIGSDRIANAVAVNNIYRSPAIVVDFGTATTFDVVSGKGEYIGGAIAPGVETSMNGLLDKAAQLYDVKLEKAARAIGNDTIESISSGFILGLAGLTDSLINKISLEIGEEPLVVGTGGFSRLMESYCEKIKKIDIFLTLKGLKIIFNKEIWRG